MAQFLGKSSRFNQTKGNTSKQGVDPAWEPKGVKINYSGNESVHSVDLRTLPGYFQWLHLSGQVPGFAHLKHTGLVASVESVISCVCRCLVRLSVFLVQKGSYLEALCSGSSCGRIRSGSRTDYGPRYLCAKCVVFVVLVMISSEVNWFSNDESRPTISDHILKSVPTDKQLNQLSSHLGPEWEQVMVDLGLKEPDLYRCKMNHLYNLQAQVFAAFVLWRKRFGTRATVQHLTNSLILADADPGLIAKIFQDDR
ncbi:death domain-containing protein CRADD [Stegostoma tigrinum]|uniref:death domain-containing protein CRADD n=1 Tax=Stegostoma tigrinum TaxID=3053191 RepID=UPI0028707A5B|nr:death domain-containing protein CRADD [Stegostoma tigrinum]